MVKIPVIVVVGPTASGKTALAISLARRFEGEIVSADSMQVYKGMDIATAMPTKDERAAAVHHLIDFLDPEEPFSVAEYTRLAAGCISDIFARGKIPVVAGGTGLYVNSLINNISFAECNGRTEYRQKLLEEFDSIGGEKMLERLRESDPETAEKLHPNDKKRIVRALEILLSSGVSKSRLDRESTRSKSPYRPLYIGLRFENRQLLYDRINRRVDAMMEQGLVAEAENCLKTGGPTAAQAIGHKELTPYFSGEISLEEALENLKRETRRYAKRQMTWFNRNEQVNWISCDDKDFGEIADEAARIALQSGLFLNTNQK